MKLSVPKPARSAFAHHTRPLAAVAAFVGATLAHWTLDLAHALLAHVPFLGSLLEGGAPGK